MIRYLLAVMISVFTSPALATTDVFDRIDVDRDGRIGKQEFQSAIGKFFDKLDKNHDGYLDREEFRTRKMPDADRIFDTLDKSGEGRISKDKFILQSMERFYRIDENADGFIDRNEYRKAAVRLFERLDKNKDGYLDRDEFRALGIPDTDAMFNDLDVNKDGRVSKDEFIKGSARPFELFDKSKRDYLDKHERELGTLGEALQRNAPTVKPFLIFYF